MSARLGPRLEAIFEAIPVGAKVADIACDRAKLGIALLQARRARAVIGVDLNAAPLQEAALAVQAAALGDKLELRQGDGMLPILESDEVACVVLAGIGGRLAARILEQARPESVRRVVVQVNRRQELARRTLVGQGFALEREELTRSEGRLFLTLVGQRPATDASRGWTALEWRWGPHLIARKDPLLRAHVEGRHAELSRALAHARAASSAERLARLRDEVEELANVVRWLAQAPEPPGSA